MVFKYIFGESRVTRQQLYSFRIQLLFSAFVGFFIQCSNDRLHLVKYFALVTTENQDMIFTGTDACRSR
jgi:hypothetical protein